MKAIFSVLGLLAVVLVIGVLAKKQLATALPSSPVTSIPAPSQGTPAANQQQQMQQMKQGIEQTLQQARPLSDDDKK